MAKSKLASASLRCGMMLVDLSGFTNLVYQAAYSDEVMEKALKGVHRFFTMCADAAIEQGGVEIINTTGDGFFAIFTGQTPTRDAVAYARRVLDVFNSPVRSILSETPFRQRVEIRIGLHWGICFPVTVNTIQEKPLYISDDLNLLARVVGSQTARRFGIAITRACYRRLMLKEDVPPADEVIIDRNRYPEQIEIYRLPSEIPEYKAKGKKNAGQRGA